MQLKIAHEKKTSKINGGILTIFRPMCRIVTAEIFNAAEKVAVYCFYSYKFHHEADFIYDGGFILSRHYVLVQMFLIITRLWMIGI